MVEVLIPQSKNQVMVRNQNRKCRVDIDLGGTEEEEEERMLT